MIQCSIQVLDSARGRKRVEREKGEEGRKREKKETRRND
jgi:hypothetical protein